MRGAAFLNLLSAPYSNGAIEIAAYMPGIPGKYLRGIDVFYRKMQREGTWDALPFIFVPAAHSQQAALIDWKNPTHSATLVGSPTFTPGQGFTTPTGNYVDTGYPINGFASNDNIMIAARCYNYVSSSNYVLGDGANGNIVRLSPHTAANQAGVRLNASVGVNASVPVNDSRTLILTQRLSSSEVDIYVGGAKAGATLASPRNSAIPSTSLCIGSGTLNSTFIASFVTGGTRITPAQIEVLSDAIEAYLAIVSPVPTGYPNQEILIRTASVTLPDIPGFSPANFGFTGTGLVNYDGSLICGDDGRYGVESSFPPYNPHIHRVALDGTLIQSKYLLTADGAMTISATTVQGVDILGDGTLAVARTFAPNSLGGQGLVQIFDPDTFAFIREFPVNLVNALCYDEATGCMVTAGISNSRNMVFRNPTTGASVFPVTLDDGVGTDVIDHMKVRFGYLWISKGANGFPGQLYKCPVPTGSGTLVPVNYYRLNAANSIEGFDLIGDDPMTATGVLMNDSKFHESPPFINEFQTYDPPPYGWG